MTRDAQEILSTLIILGLFFLYVDACAYAMYTLHSEACLCLNQRGHLAKRVKSDVENMLGCCEDILPKNCHVFLTYINLWQAFLPRKQLSDVLCWSLQRCCYEMLIIQLGWIMKYTADISMFITECDSELRFNKTIIKMVPHVGWMVVYWCSFLKDEVSNINAIAPRSKLSKHAFCIYYYSF